MSSISKYFKMNKYISVKDISSDKFPNIHKELFNSALKKYIESIKLTSVEEFSKTHTITEINNSEYCKPSSAIIKNMLYPFTSEVIDLTPYWDEYVYLNKTDESININPDDNHAINEIDYIDYMRGKITKINRYAGVKYTTSIDNETTNSPISDNLNISDTFTNLYGKSK